MFKDFKKQSLKIELRMSKEKTKRCQHGAMKKNNKVTTCLLCVQSSS